MKVSYIHTPSSISTSSGSPHGWAVTGTPGYISSFMTGSPGMFRRPAERADEYLEGLLVTLTLGLVKLRVTRTADEDRVYNVRRQPFGSIAVKVAL